MRLFFFSKNNNKNTASPLSDRYIFYVKCVSTIDGTKYILANWFKSMSAKMIMLNGKVWAEQKWLSSVIDLLVNLT